MNQIVPSIRSPSLTSSAEIYATPVRPALNLSGIPQTPVATPSSTPRPATPTSTTPRATGYQTTPPGSTSTTPRGDNTTPRGESNNNSTTTTPRRGSTATTPRGDNDNTTTPGENIATTRRDSTAIPFDLEIVSNQPPVPPSKSVWSTIFGFAFGPFASCVFPQSCAPKYEEKNNEPNNIKTESMTTADSKISPNSSKNNSGRSSPVTTNGNTENGEYLSSTPPKNDQLQKQPDAEELEWLLLDSLVGTGIIVPDLKTMFSTYFYGGRASVAILPDTQREPILIGRKNINLPVNK